MISHVFPHLRQVPIAIIQPVLHTCKPIQIALCWENHYTSPVKQECDGWITSILTGMC